MKTPLVQLHLSLSVENTAEFLRFYQNELKLFASPGLGTENSGTCVVEMGTATLKFVPEHIANVPLPAEEQAPDLSLVRLTLQISLPAPKTTQDEKAPGKESAISVPPKAQVSGLGRLFELVSTYK